MERFRGHVLVCAGAGCISSGCFEVEKALKASLAKHNLTEEFRVVETGCIGTCDLGRCLWSTQEEFSTKSRAARCRGDRHRTPNRRPSGEEAAV